MWISQIYETYLSKSFHTLVSVIIFGMCSWGGGGKLTLVPNGSSIMCPTCDMWLVYMRDMTREKSLIHLCEITHSERLFNYVLHISHSNEMTYLIQMRCYYQWYIKTWHIGTFECATATLYDTLQHSPTHCNTVWTARAMCAISTIRMSAKVSKWRKRPTHLYSTDQLISSTSLPHLYSPVSIHSSHPPHYLISTHLSLFTHLIISTHLYY